MPCTASIPVAISAIATPTRKGGPSAAPGDAHQPALGLHHRVVTGFRAPGSRLAEPGNRAINETRMLRREPLVPQPDPLHLRGSEIFDQHVGPREQRIQNRPRALVLEIERERLLVAVDAEEVGALAADKGRPPRAGVVASPRLLDLDHSSSEVAQLHRAIRPGQDAAEIQDRQPFEGSHTITT